MVVRFGRSISVLTQRLQEEPPSTIDRRTRLLFNHWASALEHQRRRERPVEVASGTKITGIFHGIFHIKNTKQSWKGILRLMCKKAQFFPLDVQNRSRIPPSVCLTSKITCLNSGTLKNPSKTTGTLASVHLPD